MGFHYCQQIPQEELGKSPNFSFEFLHLILSKTNCFPSMIIASIILTLLQP